MTVIENVSDSDATYFNAVERFCSWCKENYLDLNVKKTKEILIDFRRKPSVVPDLFIEGMKVEHVDEHSVPNSLVHCWSNSLGQTHRGPNSQCAILTGGRSYREPDSLGQTQSGSNSLSQTHDHRGPNSQ